MWSVENTNQSNPWTSNRAYRESFKPPTPSSNSSSRSNSSKKKSSSKRQWKTKDTPFLTYEDIAPEISFTSDMSPQKEAEEDQLLKRNIQVLEKKMKLYKDLLRQSEKRRERGKKKVMLTLDKLHDLLRKANEEGYAKGLRDASSSSTRNSFSNTGGGGGRNSGGDLYEDAFSLSVVSDRKTSMLLPSMTRETIP